MKMFRIALLVSAVVSLSACAHTDDRSAPAAQPDAKTAAAATAKPAAPPSADAVSCPVRGEFDPASGFFSQFYEDYILAYVLHDRTTGTFVDVGANDPNINNVTKYFYQKGWRGIDVEPNPDLVKLLRQARPEDYVAPVGISDKPATLTFYNFPTVNGLSTFDRSIADEHTKAGIKYEKLSIPVDTLNNVLAKQTIVKGPFTFMNVDVEGFEREVLSSLDFKKYPPEIVLAESTAPETENPTFHSWEKLLDDQGYIFGMDDGLNRYYVHPDHKDLLPKFVDVNYCVEKDKLAKGLKLNGYMKEKH
jgi:FkbM family methyltransferase